MLRAVTKRLIVSLVKDEKIVIKIGGDLCNLIPIRLSNMGLVAVAKVVYQQSAYVCVEVEIVELDVVNFLTKSARGPGAANMYRKICDILKWEAFESFVKQLLLSFVSKKLMVQLPVIIREKLQLKLNAEIELIACTDAEQGPFLISTMEELSTKKKAADAKQAASEIEKDS